MLPLQRVPLTATTTLLDAGGRYASLWHVQAGTVEVSTARPDGGE